MAGVSMIDQVAMFSILTHGSLHKRQVHTSAGGKFFPEGWGLFEGFDELELWYVVAFGRLAAGKARRGDIDPT